MNPPWSQILDSGIGVISAPRSKDSWRHLYSLYDAFVEYVGNHPAKLPLFNETAKKWQSESGLKQFFSGYFSPYFRDTTDTEGKDNKQTIQFCEPYYRYLYQERSELLEIESFRRLADGLMSHMLSCFSAVVPTVSALGEFEQSLYQALVPRSAMPPIALRLIRYSSDKVFATNPHVDKSAITVIADTDDAEDDPLLVFGPTTFVGQLKLSDFVPVQKRSDESLILLGAAPREAGFSKFRPSPHAVLPILTKKVRHSAIFFWLMPYLDLENFDTTIHCVDDVRLARKIIRKRKSPPSKPTK